MSNNINNKTNVRSRTAEFRRVMFPPDHMQELWNKIPPRLHGGILDYVTLHQRPGDFLRVVFENNLQEALMRADDMSILALRDLMQYIQMCAPAPCWGSVEKVANWLSDESRERAEKRRQLRAALNNPEHVVNAFLE